MQESEEVIKSFLLFALDDDDVHGGGVGVGDDKAFVVCFIAEFPWHVW